MRATVIGCQLLLAWVLWHFNEVASPKGEAAAWDAEDAFEELKPCKAMAQKRIQRFAKISNEDPIELNAGFWYMKTTSPGNTITEKWLCLPGGTNPGIIVKPFHRENK